MKQAVLNIAGKVIMGIAARLFLKYDLLKLAQLPAGAKLFASNHPTTTDPFLAGMLTKDPLYVMINANAFINPVFNAYLRNAGHIPVPRQQGRGNEIVARAVGYLQQSKAVVIFPEGALSPEEPNGFGVYDAHSGVARIALESGVPVIPVGIALDKRCVRYTQHMFPDGPTTGRWVRRGVYVVTVGAPLYFQGDPHDHAQVKQVACRVTQEIRSLVLQSQERMPRQHMQWEPFISHRRLLALLGL